MYKRMMTIISLAVILLASCAASKSAESPTVGIRDAGAAPSAPLVMEQSAVARSASGTGANSYSSTQPTNADRMVVKNASLSIAVDDPPVVMERISKMAEEMGGFVVSANVYQTTLDSGVEVPHATISIRVPAEKLDEAMSRIKAETQQPVMTENISSQDVTADYTDLQSRLRNQEAAEKQLQQIMDKATKPEDVLSIFNQLTQVREQIELIKGQIQFYEQSAALSMISTELYANAAVRPVTIGGWQPKGVAKQALQALVNTLKFLATAAIWIFILVVPVLIVVLLPPVVIILLVLRWRNRKKAKSKPVVAS